MSRVRKNRHNKKVGGKSFVILPILFFVGIFTVMYIAIAPAFGSLISAAGVMFSDGERDYSTEYKNIFVPVQDFCACSGERNGRNGHKRSWRA